MHLSTSFRISSCERVVFSALGSYSYIDEESRVDAASATVVCVVVLAPFDLAEPLVLLVWEGIVMVWGSGWMEEEGSMSKKARANDMCLVVAWEGEAAERDMKRQER